MVVHGCDIFIFSELLEKDREFRHAVAGIIGYGDILESIKIHDKKFNEIIGRIDKVEECIEILGQKIELLLEVWGEDGALIWRRWF